MLSSWGTHIMLPLKYSNKSYGLLIPKTKDGRIIFVLPYLGKSLVGTTDIFTKKVTNDPKTP